MNYSNQLVIKTKLSIIILILILFISFKNSYCSNINFNKDYSDTTTSQLKNDSIFVMKKSPWGAVARSAILPGLGQFYNESYWKIPVIFTAIGYLSYQWKFNNDNYSKYKNLFLESIKNNSQNNNYYRLREFYRDQRDMFAIYIGLTYLLNLIDAYVDAHLFDFDVNETTNFVSLKLTMKIKL